MNSDYHDDYIVGTCESMCPASEISLRKNNRMVHYFEKTKLIKSFSRSAAAQNKAKCEDLRTFSALEATVNYLFNK